MPTSTEQAIRPDSTILSEIRARTSGHHQSMEKHVNVMDPNLTREQYGNLLKQFYAFYNQMENAATERFQPEELQRIEFDMRKKSPLFERDFNALGIDSVLPSTPELPAMATFHQLLGCFYVLEGATLGGQFISAHLQKQLGITPESGGAFYNSYGKDVPLRWKTYCAFLQENAVDEKSQEEIIAAACQTFEKLGQWFEQCAQSRQASLSS